MLNKFIGIGNLGADPVIRSTQEGKTVATFSIYCDSGYGEYKKTEYIKAVAFGRLAETIGKYMKKGDKCMIEGPIQIKKWQDKNGNQQSTVEVSVSEFKMLPTGKTKQHAENYEMPF